MLPQDLATRFRNAREFRPRDDTGNETWLANEVSSGAPVVIKLSIRSRGLGDALFASLREWNTKHPDDALAIPTELGRAGDGRYFETAPFRSAGSLADQPNLVRARTHCRDLVKQMVSCLVVLHEQIPGGPVVHGDIKPSNIFVEELPDGRARYLLSDFDAARQFDSASRTGPHPSRYTPRYAAPEVLPKEGEVTPAVDYWSLGMTLLECLTGSHPLAGMRDPAVCTLLAGVWRPPQIAEVDDVRMRALLSGLLDRDSYSRWGGTQCQRWLDGDMAILADGLNKLNESSSEVPYDVEGIPVISARNLAETLLERWSTSQLTSSALASWLRDHLRRGDVAALLDRLVADVQLPMDVKLLHFCHALYADIHPKWLERELSATSLEAAGQAAALGDTRSLDWLRSLLDGAAFQFYGQHGHTEIEGLGQRFLDGWANYQTSWEEIIAQGAPETARPRDEQALPLLASTIFSDEARAALRARARDFLGPVTLLLREPWFLHFGTDIDAMTEAQLVILQHLDRTAQLSVEQIGVLSELGDVDTQQLRQGANFLETQRRLLGEMHVGKATAITVLHSGDSYRSRPAEHFTDYTEQVMRRVGGVVRHRLARLSDWVLRKLHIARARRNEEDLWLQLRMVRLASRGVVEAMPLRIEAYLAMVSWRAAEGLRPRLRVTYPGFLLSYPRLVTPILANQGHLLLVLSSDTRVELEARQHWYQRWGKTAAIELLLRDAPHPLSRRGRIVPTRSRIGHAGHQNAKVMPPRSQRLMPATGRLWGTQGRISALRTASPKPMVTRAADVREASRFEKRLLETLLNIVKAR